MNTKMIKAIAFILALILLIGTVNTASASTQYYTPSPDDWDMTYADLARLYVDHINGWINGSCPDHDLFNPLVVEDFWSYDQAKTRAGFILTDVNADGVYELLIISEEDDIVGLYTMVNGKLREVIAGGYRNHCSLLSDGSFYIQGASGYMSASYSTWYLRTVGKLWYDSGYLLDGWFGTNEPTDEQWFRYNPSSPDSGSEDRRVSVLEAVGWMNAVDGRIVKVKHWIPFASYEAAGCPDYIPYTPFSELR